RRFQSSASMRPPMSDGSRLAASISASVTWAKRRYSVSRGLSALVAACWYACRDIPQPFVFVLDKLPTQHQRLVVLALHAVFRNIDAVGEHVGVTDHPHEFAHPTH